MSATVTDSGPLPCLHCGRRLDQHARPDLWVQMRGDTLATECLRSQEPLPSRLAVAWYKLRLPAAVVLLGVSVGALLVLLARRMA